MFSKEEVQNSIFLALLKITLPAQGNFEISKNEYEWEKNQIDRDMVTES